MTTRTAPFFATAVLILLSVVFVLPHGIDAQEATTMPERLEPIRLFQEDYPFWLSARAADRGDGEVAWDLLQPGMETSLSRLASQNAEQIRNSGETGLSGPCAVVLVEPLEDPLSKRSSESFDSLMRSSDAILRGKILEIDVGFVRGWFPASLLRVQVESTLLQPQGFTLPEEILVAYKQAAVTIGDNTYCSGFGDGYSPKVGDQLIYFFFGIPTDTTGRLSMPYHRQLVFGDSEGQLVTRQRSLEEGLQRAGKVTLDDLSKMVRNVLDSKAHLDSK